MSQGADSAPAFREAIRRGDRRAIARTITLLESTRPDQGDRYLNETFQKCGHSTVCSPMPFSLGEAMSYE